MKKSIVISLLTVATLVCTALCSLASTGVVTTDTLRVRKEASTDSSIIALLSMNDKIEILGEEYGWYKIKSGDTVGYVAAQYINVTSDTNVNEENSNKDNNNQEANNSENQNNENSSNNENTNQESENKGNTENVNKETVNVLLAEQKIYITPLINSLVIDTIKEEKQIEVINEVSGWSYIQAGTITGWVRTENIQKKEKEVEKETSNPEKSNETSSQNIGYISGTSVNFRKTPNTSGEVISKFPKNTKVTIITKGDEWTQVEHNGETGYVSSDYISDKKVETTSRSATSKVTNKNEKKTSEEENTPVVSGGNGSEVVSYAKKYLGYKYTSGGSSPKTGFDCSGFTTYIYKHFGVSLSRTSRGQSTNGTAVNKNNLTAGDIICFSSSGGSKSIGHVGIYVGGGKFIHSANSRQGVIISNVSGDGYYFVTARRVI